MENWFIMEGPEHQQQSQIGAQFYQDSFSAQRGQKKSE